MEEKKYYTPTLDEFHVGFEFELKIGNDEWACCIWDTKMFKDGVIIHKDRFPVSLIVNENVDENDKPFTAMDYGIIRVKYLDREDIEAEGWKFESEGNLFFTFTNGQYYIRWWYNKNEIEILYDAGALHFNRFTGFIRNRSELHRIMQMVGIIKPVSNASNT